MKHRVICLAVAAILSASAATAEVVDGVVAIVNGEVITYSQVRDYMRPVEDQLRHTHSGPELIEQLKAAQQDALNGLIDRALILQEFKEKKYNIPETVVEQQLNDVISTDFSGDRTSFIKTLQAEHLTLSQYRDRLRDRIIVQAMRNKKVQQEMVASPYRIEQYYQKNLDRFKVEERIKLRMIYIRKNLPAPAAPRTNEVPAAAASASPSTNAPAAAVAAVGTNGPPVAAAPVPAVDSRRELAEELRAKLDAGESFESLAKVYSEGKEREQGGDWGWAGRGDLLKELGNVAFSLKPGQHSRVIEVPAQSNFPGGYYLLMVEDVKPARVKPLSEVRDEIEKILLQEQRAKLQDEWVRGLRAKAYIRLF